MSLIIEYYHYLKYDFTWIIKNYSRNSASKYNINPSQLFGIPPHLFGTADYVFQNRDVPFNYWVREEEIRNVKFLVWCAGVAVCGRLLVAGVRLLVVCSRMLVVCGSLWSFVAGFWWLMKVCGGLWCFAVVAYFSYWKYL